MSLYSIPKLTSNLFIVINMIFGSNLFAISNNTLQADTVVRRNVESDSVIHWVIDEKGILNDSGFFESGSLVVNQITDDNGNIDLVYFNEQNIEILIRKIPKSTNKESHDLYYAYYSFGEIGYILTPNFINNYLNRKMSLNSCLDNYSYQYVYDSALNLASKKIPGAELTYLIYNKEGRLVLFTSASDLKRNKWGFNKYDSAGRVILHGNYKTNKSVASLRKIVRMQSTKFERRIPKSKIGYTHKLSFPPVNKKDIFSVFYFDDYSFVNAISLGDRYEGFNYQASKQDSVLFQCSPNDRATGLKVRGLKKSQWIKTVVYYDENKNIIQTVQENHLGGIDRVKSLYYDNGLIEKSSITHATSDAKRKLQISRVYEYENEGYSIKESINDQEPITFRYRYGNYNNVVTKVIDNIWEFNYDYVKINGKERLKSVNARTTLNDDKKALALNISYQKGAGFKNSSNAASVKFHVKLSDDEIFIYSNSFDYDSYDRIINANLNISAPNSLSDNYQVSNVTYDHDGNISTLRRIKNDSVMDDLKYQYEGSNVSAISDLGDSNIMYTTQSDESSSYSYDAKGNLIKIEDGKLKTKLKYGNTGMPNFITFPNKTKYKSRYDSEALLLRETVKNPHGTTKLDYITHAKDYYPDYIKYGTICYKNNDISHIRHQEGNWVYNGSRFVFNFHLKDNVNRVVAVLTDEGQVRNLRNYFPYGVPIFLIGEKTLDYNFSKTSSGFINELIKFDFRFYDPVIGRFINPNVLAELELTYNPYHFAFDNPTSNQVVLGITVNE